MHLPDGLTGIPAGVKVAQAADAHVAAIVTAAQISDRSSGVADFGIPTAASVRGLINSPNVGGEFSLIPAKGCNQIRLTWEFGVKKESGPVAAAIAGVHQQARLTSKPAVLTVEIDADQSEILFFR